MKIQKILLSVTWLLVVSASANADSALMHTSGSVEVSVTDFGSLARIGEGADVAPNFKFPKTGDTYYLQERSEIWIGDANGNVASTWEVTDRFVLGDWATTETGTIVGTVESNGREVITAQYDSSGIPGLLPISILVDQESFSWNPSNHPDADDFIVINLRATNNGDEDLQGIYVAIMANWDVDGTDLAAGQLSQDWVDWDEDRQTLFTYDGDDTDGINPVHAALTLLDGELSAHHIFTFIGFNVQFDLRLFNDTARSALMSDPAASGLTSKQDLEAIGQTLGFSGAWDYVSIISSGPYDIAAKDSITATFALVAGEDLADLQKNIDEAQRISFAPPRLTATVISGGVTLEWEASLIPSVAGYTVLRQAAEGGDFQQIGPRIINELSFTDTDIDRFGIEYTYRIRSVDASGQLLAFDSPAARAIPDIIPNPPAGLTATLRENQISLEWAKSTQPIGGYVINRNHTGREPWTPIASVSPEVSTFDDANIYPGLHYFYAITAENQSGTRSEFSEAADVRLPGESIISPESNLDNVIVVPNPYRLSGNANPIEFRNLPHRATIHIYSSAGDLLKTIDHRNETPVERWDGRIEKEELISAGIYVYYIELLRESGRGKITTGGKFAVIR